MKILVCLKQVPDTTDVKIDPQTNTLIRQGIKNITNPFDAYALEEGVRLKERYGGQVTAISMGPPQAETVLRDAIAAGADDAVLISDGAFAGADTLATAFTISCAVKMLGAYDLVICGRQTIDGDTGQVGPELAVMLGMSFIAYVSRIEEIEDNVLRVRRLLEDGYEIMETTLPAVITVVKEINVPRLPSLRGLTRAKSAVIPVMGAGELGVDKSVVGLAGSATWVTKIFSPKRSANGEILEGSIPEQLTNLINKLREASVI